MAVKCDVAKEEEIKAVYEVAKTKFGGVDVCINNAGIGHNAPLLSGETSEWRDMLEVAMIAYNCAATGIISAFFAGQCSWVVCLHT